MGDESGWLIERWINSELRYWNGFDGEDSTVNFTTRVDEAVRFAREVDASVVLAHQLNGNGRVAQHVWSRAAVEEEDGDAEPKR